MSPEDRAKLIEIVATLNRIAADRGNGPKAGPHLPTGSGMFISRTQKIDTQSIRQRVADAKLKWVSVLVEWQHRNEASWLFNRKAIHLERIKAFQDLGLEVWPWAYPVPGEEAALATSLGSMAQEWGSPGVIIDPEHLYYSKKEAALKLTQVIRAMADEHKLSCGITSYGAPWYHSSFPFVAFSGLDFGIPQTYDAKNQMGPEYPKRSHKAWTASGYKHLVGAFGTFGKTTKQLRDLLDTVALTGASAAIGWKWETTSSREFQTIGEVQWKGSAWASESQL